MVVGASGEFFRVADTVLCMEDYQPKDVTAEAKRIYWEGKDPGSAAAGEQQFPPLRERSFSPGEPAKNGCAPDGKCAARSLRVLQYGEQEVELTYVEQLVELG